MKQSIIFLFSLLLLGACVTKQSVPVRETDSKEDADSTEYELIVFDSGFESWFLTRAKPVDYHEQCWYEHWNKLYVQAWNTRNLGGRYAQLIDGMINYDPNADYGAEINHKLFYYFMYVEHELGIPIVPEGPRSW